MRKRLFVSRCYPDDTAFVAYCNARLSSRDYRRGEGWRPAFEIQIQILKAARLLEKIGNRVITKQLIIRCLESLNTDCKNRLGTLAEVYSVTSCDWTKGPGYNRQIYCEEPALSLPAEGIQFKALLVDADSVPLLTPDLLQKWIDFCAMFLDLENYTPQGPAESRARRYMAERRTMTIAKHITTSAPHWRPKAKV